ncbi:hypothetical protein FQA39_LY03972 [Lamprigera yunnana]|nr:hypothetical protein FQA39_LY03972 [Lamprigera yunnana]
MEDEIYFKWVDYVLFFLTLLLSFVIGVYIAVYKNKDRTTSEYSLGSRSMSFFPIGLSLVSSHVSGNTLIAVPAEIYQFGCYYFLTILSDVLIVVLMYYIFLPLYFKLQLTSIFEYLKQRFDVTLLRLVSVLNIIGTVTYTPLVIYLPAVTFSRVTGLNLYMIIIVISLMCIIYTTVGGFKAVIWTDAVQFFMMVGSMFVVLYLGIHSAGGLPIIWKTAKNRGFFDIFDFSFDATRRDTFWSAFVGNLFFGASISVVNASCMQKYLALPDFSKVKKCVALHFAGIIVIKLVTVFTAVAAYAYYVGCDPITTNRIKAPDQLMSLFVMDISKNLPGLPGLYIVGICSAALSTLSSNLNTISMCVYQDLLLPWIPTHTTEERRTNILKLLVLIFGGISVVLALLVEKIGGIFAFATAAQGISGGPLLGLFILGMFFPCANAKGSLIGGTVALIINGWLIFGNMWYRTQGLLEYKRKPTFTDNCPDNINTTIIISSTIKSDADIFILYRISFWYFTVIGTIMVVVVGVIVSWLTKEKNFKVNSNLLSPIARVIMRKTDVPHSGVYYDVNEAKIVTSERSDNTNFNCKTDILS